MRSPQCPASAQCWVDNLTESLLDHHHVSHHIQLDTERQEEETRWTMSSRTSWLPYLPRTFVLRRPFFACCLTPRSSFAALCALFLLSITMKVLGGAWFNLIRPRTLKLGNDGCAYLAATAQMATMPTAHTSPRSQLTMVVQPCHYLAQCVDNGTKKSWAEPNRPTKSAAW